eukprot:TRINITY_DN27172_c0_g1_i1.p1 TRINITY_DN27172_c0_g1~~TRINITY_DN27172_c0_g1_i1.p1  ORF type:complete len:186 (-),score=50.68 TRINITY_DN27172_c0_g1_i1:127-684(-)
MEALKAQLKEAEAGAEMAEVYKRQHDILIESNEALGVDRMIDKNSRLKSKVASLQQELKLKDWQIRSVARGIFSDEVLSSSAQPSVEQGPLAGYMKKKGEGRFSGWKKRWFTLDNSTLTWFDKEGSDRDKPNGQLLMSDVLDLHFEEESLGITIYKEGRVFRLQCFELHEFENWSKALILFVNPY